MTQNSPSPPPTHTHLEQEAEQDGGKGSGGGGVGQEGVRDDLEGVVGLDPLHKVLNHLCEDLLEHGHVHHCELEGGGGGGQVITTRNHLEISCNQYTLYMSIHSWRHYYI